MVRATTLGLTLSLACFGCVPFAARPAEVVPSPQWTAPPVAPATPGPNPLATPDAPASAAWVPLPSSAPVLPPAPTLAASPDAASEPEELPVDELDEGDTLAQSAADRAAAADQPRPYAELTDQALRAALTRDPASLGCMSLGLPYGGALYNGVRLPTSERWVVLHPGASWATQETVDYLAAAIDRVREQFPATPPLLIGDLSARSGGRLKRHLSHQAGRDVDTGWYYQGGVGTWYQSATRRTLDIPRTWALVRALITETDVELILIDQAVQLLLHEHATAIGEDPAWLGRIFQYPGGRGTLIRHATGHRTHIHVRFYNPRAQELGRRAQPILVELGKLRPPTYTISYTTRRGDSLAKIARRYKTTVQAIRQANGLRSNLIHPGRRYRIPQQGGTRMILHPVVIPARRLPPTTPPPPPPPTTTAPPPPATAPPTADASPPPAPPTADAPVPTGPSPTPPTAAPAPELTPATPAAAPTPAPEPDPG